MDAYGRGRIGKEGSSSDPAADWNPPVALEESMLELSIGVGESYPERPGERDCEYYLRTGYCGFGTRCRYNHPRNQLQVMGIVGPGASEYPERLNQPDCLFFLKTGTCKFGAACKYHHPKRRDNLATPAALNYGGYPLRPGEKECSYYLKTGHCKFGVTCKFHHPELSGVSMPTSAMAFYPQMQTTPAPSLQHGGVSNWQVVRPPLLPGSYVQGPYGPMPYSPGMVPVPGYITYAPPASLEMSPGAQNVTASAFGPTQQILPAAPAYLDPSSSFVGPSGSNQKENMFPERPGQPQCQFYMKTGDCKFGSSCKYHHPRDWIVPKISSALNPSGLPLRPGATPCTFYAQHGECKFGPPCKYDYPMGTVSYSSSASSLADMHVAPYPVGSSLAILAPSSSSSEPRPVLGAEAANKEASSSRMPTTENPISSSVGLNFSKSGAGYQSYVPYSSQQSPRGRQDSENVGSN